MSDASTLGSIEGPGRARRTPSLQRWIASWLCGLLFAFAGPASAQAAGALSEREESLRAALVRMQPAPRVQEVVNELLYADVQVIVVRNAPGGIGAYYPGVSVTGLNHVYRNPRDQRIYYGPRGLIVLDARLEEQATRETIAFVVAHEYGHHHLHRGHTEHDADAFARRLLEHRGMWAPGTAGEAFGFAAGWPWARRLPLTTAARMRALDDGTRALASVDAR